MRFYTILQSIQLTGKICGSKSRSYPLAVAFLKPAVHDIFGYRRRENLIILKYRSDFAAVSLNVIFPYVNTVVQNYTVRRIVKPHNELDKRGLSCPVIPDYRDFVSGINSKTNVPQRVSASAVQNGSFIILVMIKIFRMRRKLI